jgi:hypothetical protein
MERRFEVFQAPRKYAVGARVTLTHKGVFVFNRRAMELLGSPEAVIFLFDRESEAVAFAPSVRSVPHAYPITVSPKSGAGATSGAKFCTHYHIRREGSLRCIAELSEGRLVIHLRQGARCATRRRGFAPAAPSLPEE